MVTNCYKYAFDGRKKGKIEVVIPKIQENYCKLFVKDDGLGLPKNVDIENSNTLGLSLTQGLTERLEGKVEVEINQGTIFIISFRPKAFNLIEAEN